ncbi:MAG: hypothetical protein AAFX78_01570 [Cyanobacteria bacterium J06638_20]
MGAQFIDTQLVDVSLVDARFMEAIAVGINDGNGFTTGWLGDRPDLQRLNIVCRYALRDSQPVQRLLPLCAV